MTATADLAAFDALLDFLKRGRGFDFSGYKRATLVRRVQKRLQAVGAKDFADYIDYLEVHPEEFAQLFNTILINVTAFFRDPAAWDYLAADVVPRVLAARQPDGQVRAWSAGCASGEEAYTIAMLLAEAIGIKAFTERVKIYATDLDEEELAQARLGGYTHKQVAGVPGPMLQKYFERVGDRYVFHRDLRRSIIFGSNNLIHDAPISRIDLLVCRNTLMYFNTEVQARILARFHFALHDDGFLFLGRAEMLLTHANLFTPVDLKRRVFTKVPRRNNRDRLLAIAQNDGGGGPGGDGHAPATDGHIREVAFDIDPTAQMIVDTAGIVLVANDRFRKLFSLVARDLGRPLQDLECSYRPVELRSLLDQAYGQRRPISVKDIEWPTATDRRFLDLQIVPLLGDGGTVLGAKVLFTDISRYKKLQEDLQQSKQELETAYEELQTTNEELQSTVEELETTNEELQSTNEEMETTNEELHSTNEELQTINDELRARGAELNHVNAFLESILASIRSCVIVLDTELRVTSWNVRCEEVWGLPAADAKGSHMLNLDIGLPVEQLRGPIRECLTEGSSGRNVTLAALNRRGRKVRCSVTCTALLGAEKEVRGVILLLEVEPDAAV